MNVNAISDELAAVLREINAGHLRAVSTLSEIQRTEPTAETADRLDRIICDLALLAMRLLDFGIRFLLLMSFR